MIRLVVFLIGLTGASALAVEPAPAPHQAGPSTYGQVVGSALADAKLLPADVALRTRYLDARNYPTEQRKEFYSVTSFHVNSLSREHKRVPPRQVSATLWAVNLDDYRWDSKTWETLKGHNSYYLIPVKVPGKPRVIKKLKQVQYTDGSIRPETVDEEVAGEDLVDHIPGPWLPTAEITELVRLTGSSTPIVRADEFLFQTGAQVDRAGHGYYDWFAFKSRKDAEQLARLDRKGAEEAYRELAAIVPVSGVALNNRQVFRFATLVGSWWETRDVLKKSAGQQNAVANLLADFKHDAEEITFSLPNGLPAFYLSDAAGKQIDSVPDTVASDNRSTNNDHRIHPLVSCVTCHQDAGLKPIRDYARKLYDPSTGVGLAALDRTKTARLESVYLGPLERNYKRDVGDYSEAIEELTGLKPTALARAYETAWSRYIDDPVTLERAAVETGVTPEVLKNRLREYGRAKGVVDPVLVGYLVDDPPPVRREYFEERFPVLMLVLQGANP